jgi:hypothetical protein
MSIRKDNAALSNRYEMIMEGNYSGEILEEGIKDVILAGLLGLLSMSAAKGEVKDVTRASGPDVNKTQIQQMVQQASSVDQIKKVILNLINNEISGIHKANEGMADYPKSVYDAYHYGDQIKSNNEHTIELNQLKTELAGTTDAQQIANLVHNAGIGAVKITDQQKIDNTTGRVDSVVSGSRSLGQ